MKRIPSEVAEHKLGVSILTNLLESLALFFRASVLAIETMVYVILLSQENRDDSDKY